MSALNGIDGDDPPIFIAHGTADPTVPFWWAEAIADRAEQVGLPYELLAIEGGDHSAPLNVMPLQRSVEFAYTHLAIPEPTTLALLATGAIGLLAYGWRRRKAP